MNTSNRIPESFEPLVAWAEHAYRGLLEHGEATGLKHHDAFTLRGTIDRLTGRPADPAITGSTPLIGAQPAYLATRSAHAAARKLEREAASHGRDFCARAVDMVKSHLGRRWNARWMAVGFTGGSLALNGDPLMILHGIAAYLRRHPEHENAPLEITEQRASEVAVALINARTAAETAHAAEITAKQQRDAAFADLRRQLSSLRSELAYLLTAGDARWYHYGFHRPADGRSPQPVKEIAVRPAAEGFTAHWPAAVRATGYRLAYRAAGSTAQPITVALTRDPQAIVRDLPTGIPLTLALYARNRTGESTPLEATLTL